MSITGPKSSMCLSFNIDLPSAAVAQNVHDLVVLAVSHLLTNPPAAIELTADERNVLKQIVGPGAVMTSGQPSRNEKSFTNGVPAAICSPGVCDSTTYTYVLDREHVLPRVDACCTRCHRTEHFYVKSFIPEIHDHFALAHAQARRSLEVFAGILAPIH